MSEPSLLREWADPKLVQADAYHKRDRYWKIGTVVLMLGAGLAAYYLTKPDLVWGISTPLGIFFVSSILKDAFLKYPRVTLPQRYSLLLLRLLRRSGESSFSEFEHTLDYLIEQIDQDRTELRENLAASRTVRVLTLLRTYVLKFATVVADKGKTIDPVTLTRMKQTISQVAEMFYRFDDVEGLSPFLNSYLGNITSIPEQAPTVSPWRPLVNFLRPWYRMPFSVHLLTLVAIALASAWILLLTNPGLVILVPISLAILSVFQGQLRQWLQSVFKE